MKNAGKNAGLTVEDRVNDPGAGSWSVQVVASPTA